MADGSRSTDRGSPESCRPRVHARCNRGQEPRRGAGLAGVKRGVCNFMAGGTTACGAMALTVHGQPCMAVTTEDVKGGFTRAGKIRPARTVAVYAAGHPGVVQVVVVAGHTIDTGMAFMRK